MTLTTTLKQLLDDDGHAPLELTWDIEYVPTSEGFVIRSKTVEKMQVWINGTAYDVDTYRYERVNGETIRLDAYRDAEIAYAHLLNEGALREACQEHWDTDGAREWGEPGRAA